jgi:hypothetical protein
VRSACWHPPRCPPPLGNAASRGSVNAPTARRPAYGGAARLTDDHLPFEREILISPERKVVVCFSVLVSDWRRRPDLRVCLAELGFAWLPSLLWRFDKDWKALWRETPWVRDKPSVYVRRHLRATTSPTLIPGRVPASELAQLAEMLDAGHMLLYSSDHPHDHGSDALENLLAVLGEENREAVLSKSPAHCHDREDFFPDVRNSSRAMRAKSLRQKKSLRDHVDAPACQM